MKSFMSKVLLSATLLVGGNSFAQEVLDASVSALNAAEWTRVDQVTESQVRAYNQNPSSARGKIPAELIGLISKKELIASMSNIFKTLQKVVPAGDFPARRASFNLSALRQGDLVYVTLSVDTDERSESSLQVAITFNRKTGHVLQWTGVEAVDHP